MITILSLFWLVKNSKFCNSISQMNNSIERIRVIKNNVFKNIYYYIKEMQSLHPKKEKLSSNTVQITESATILFEKTLNIIRSISLQPNMNSDIILMEKSTAMEPLDYLDNFSTLSSEESNQFDLQIESDLGEAFDSSRDSL